MNAQEMAQKVSECKALRGVEVDVIERRNMIGLYGFHQTAGCDAARAAAEALGFSCGPNSGTWTGTKEVPSIREAYDKKSPAEQRTATLAWLQLGGFADFLVCGKNGCDGHQAYVGQLGQQWGTCPKCGNTAQF